MRILINKILTYFHKLPKNSYLIIGFFCFLSIGLLLGDGKQALIETFSAGGIIALFIYAKIYCKKYREMPRNILFFWIAILCYFVVRTIFSDSIGYSVTSTIRVIMSYVIFTLFYEYTGKNFLKLFIQCLIIFSVTAILFSLLFLLLPQQTTFLPLMNLLYANYGHNYLANIIVIVYPFALLSFLKTRNAKTVGIYIFLVLALLFTFSRGAQLLLGLYTVFQLGLLRPKKISFPFLCILFVGLLGVFSLFFFSFHTIRSSTTRQTPESNIVKLPKKQPLAEEGRIKYWLQALHAIKEKPIFGTGPGTFYIQSKLFQEHPGEYSWYTHNFFLEILTETGIVGTLLITGMLLIIFSDNIKTYLTKFSIEEHTFFSTALFIGTFLTFLYSMIEFNINFLVIWILFWAASGIVVRGQHENIASASRAHSILMTTSVLFLTIFYCSSLVSVLSLLMNKKSNIGFYIHPVNSENVSSLISHHTQQNSELSSTEKKLILLLHRNEAEIMAQLAELYKNLHSVPEAEEYYVRTLTLDPKNTSNHAQYIEFLLAEDNTVEKIYHEMLRLNHIFLTSRAESQLNAVRLPTDTLRYLYTKENLVHEAASPGIDYYISFYYKFGLSLLETQPEAVRTMWEIMYDLHPGWSYFYLDFASFIKYTYHDNTKALKILEACQNDIYAGEYCKKFSVITLPTQSILRQDISFN